MSPIKLLVLCVLVCIFTVDARAGSQGASPVTTASAGASSVSTGVAGLLSNGQVVTTLGRMVSRYGARVTAVSEARRQDGGRVFTIFFEVPGMMARPRRVSMAVWAHADGTIDHVFEPSADL